MQVYKVFFRILNKQKVQVIMYLGIFMGIAALTSSQGKSNEEKQFEASSYAFAIFDYDQSPLSQGLAAYLSQQNEQVEIEDNAENIQDGLYNREIECALRIPEGFGASAELGGEPEKIEISAIPGTVYGETFQNMTGQYLSLVKGYMAGGFTAKEALAKAEITSRKQVPVEMSEGQSGSTHSGIYYCFAYVPYIFISACVAGIAPALMIFHRRDMRDRNNCSAYSLSRSNFELVAATGTAGLGLCLVFFLMVLFIQGGEMFSFRGFLFTLNELCFLVVALGIVFLISQMVKKTSAISMVSNAVGLGMSFLSGVFVPLEYLGEGIIKAAHLLPAYWYILAVRFIDGYTPGASLTDLWKYMGIELLFGVALFCVGSAYSRMKMRQTVPD